MKYLTRGLGGLLALCLMLRVGAWLVEPALPLVAVLFFLTAIFTLTGVLVASIGRKPDRARPTALVRLPGLRPSPDSTFRTSPKDRRRPSTYNDSKGRCCRRGSSSCSSFRSRPSTRARKEGST